MLENLKDYLRITWDDEDSLLESFIERGKAYLEDLTGTEIDFDKAPAKSLLLDYCRYCYNNASEYFEENFQREILRLQLKSAVNANDTEE